MYIYMYIDMYIYMWMARRSSPKSWPSRPSFSRNSPRIRVWVMCRALR